MEEKATESRVNPSKFKVYCLLGHDKEIIEVHEFETKKEQDAFMLGLNQGIGWLDGLWTNNLKEFYRDCLPEANEYIEDEVSRFQKDYPLEGERC